MITARPMTEYIAYANQDCDELQALLCDLQASPREYLSHTDGFVRSMADWTMEYYKLRNIRTDVSRDVYWGRTFLKKLYARLRVLATPEDEPEKEKKAKRKTPNPAKGAQLDTGRLT